MEKVCPHCKKIFEGKNKFCCKECYWTSNQLKEKAEGSYLISNNKNKKWHKGYSNLPNSGSFKKGLVPWNKGTGGIIINKGYRKIKINSRYIPEHDIIWCISNDVNHLPENCIIHHINQRIKDNNINNLQLMTRDFHIKLHRTFNKDG